MGDNMASASNKQLELWKQYADTKNPAIKRTTDYWILKYCQVHCRQTQHILWFQCWIWWFDRIWNIGLIDAIEKFDINKGVKFETYASLRIRGSIIDSIRELDWVPRSLRQKNKELEKVYAEIENELGRSASDKRWRTSLN